MGAQMWIAIGDSFTAGTGDDDHGGWIARTYDGVAGTASLNRFVNLAQRGVDVATVLAEQAPRLRRCTIVSAIAGANDLMRPRVDRDLLKAQLDLLVETALGSGTTVLTCTCPDFCVPRQRKSPRLLSLVAWMNDHVRRRASLDERIVVVPAFEVLQDPNLWAEDNLHPNPRGHAELARAAQKELSGRLDAL
jgi:lysophospholipase L1-like esterase